jgi:hypothetical protein
VEKVTAIVVPQYLCMVQNARSARAPRRVLRGVCCFLRRASLAVPFSLACALSAQQSKPTEYAVKATYLFNFARFVEWPASLAASRDAFSICVLGEDPFGRSLDAILAGEKIAGKSVVSRRISKPQDAAACRIVFISSSEDARLKDLLAALGKVGTLTVSDIPRFSSRGGMIGFISEGNRVRFEVNLTCAQDAGLTMSSELLKVAVAVRREPQPGD